VNSAAINMGVQISLLFADLDSFKDILRSFTESYGSSMFKFSEDAPF
jgi:hypothetical protein